MFYEKHVPLLSLRSDPGSGPLCLPFLMPRHVRRLIATAQSVINGRMPRIRCGLKYKMKLGMSTQKVRPEELVPDRIASLVICYTFLPQPGEGISL